MRDWDAWYLEEERAVECFAWDLVSWDRIGAMGRGGRTCYPVREYPTRDDGEWHSFGLLCFGELVRSGVGFGDFISVKYMITCAF